ncbi:hypothetical protein HC928_04175 [bacterium]|nr:hypothetical protein [bacterium]
MNEEEDDYVEYTQFSRYQNALPQWIWNDLSGIDPQKRRQLAFKSEFKVPLSFKGTVFDTFIKVSTYGLVSSVVRLFWGSLTSVVPILSGLLIGYLVLYFVLKWAQIKNTQSIREEIIYGLAIDLFALGVIGYEVFTQVF